MKGRKYDNQNISNDTIPDINPVKVDRINT